MEMIIFLLNAIHYLINSEKNVIVINESFV